MPRLEPPLVGKDDSFGNTVTLIHSGQTRAYGGNLWAGTVHCERDELNHRDMALARITQAVGEGYIFPKGVDSPFYCPVLEKLEQSTTDPHTWHFRVERAYLD